MVLSIERFEHTAGNLVTPPAMSQHCWQKVDSVSGTVANLARVTELSIKAVCRSLVETGSGSAGFGAEAKWS